MLPVGVVSHGAPGFRSGYAEIFGACGGVARACLGSDAVAHAEGVGSLEELPVVLDDLGPPYPDNMMLSRLVVV